MFREAFVRESFDFDFMYDWILKKQALKQRLAANTRNTQQNKRDDSNVRQLPNRGSSQPNVLNPAQRED